LCGKKKERKKEEKKTNFEDSSGESDIERFYRVSYGWRTWAIEGLWYLSQAKD